jgi:hypothetical protein
MEEYWGRAHNINPNMAASMTGWARALLHNKIWQTNEPTVPFIYTNRGVHPEQWGDEGAGAEEEHRASRASARVLAYGKRPHILPTHLGDRGQVRELLPGMIQKDPPRVCYRGFGTSSS